MGRMAVGWPLSVEMVDLLTVTSLGKIRDLLEKYLHAARTLACCGSFTLLASVARIACCGSCTLLASVAVAMTDGEPFRHLVSSRLPADGSSDRIEK